MVIAKQFKQFILEIKEEEKIPARDKKILAAVLVLIILRILFIPDWLPFSLFAPLDIFLLIALIFDYFFTVIDHNLLLKHYPWTMKSFARLQRIGRFFSFFVPSFISDHLWQYVRDPF